MSYGILITNPEGKVQIDGERVMPKLHAHGRIHLNLDDFHSKYGAFHYRNFDFTPTKRPVFVTLAIDETVPAEPGNARWVINPHVFRNSSNEFYRARIEAIGGPCWVYVWVYVL